MQIEFEKWHGCRNDFILIWLGPNKDQVYDSLLNQASSLCSRFGDGIGADGVIILHHPQRGELKPEAITVINSDGSLAETCGNGIRCAALAILRRQCEFHQYSKDLPQAVSFKVGETMTTCRYLGPNRMTNFDYPPNVALDMGRPKLNKKVTWYETAESQVKKCIAELKLTEKLQDWAACELANKHIVLFFEEVSQDMIRQIGPRLQDSDAWDGINVHICAPAESKEELLFKSSISELHKVIVWERGVGETQACGSGACAVAASILDTGLTSRDQWLAISMPGGIVRVKQQDSDDPMTLAGPANYVFSGVIDL